MTLEATMQALAKAGTAQNRRVYARHGVGPDQYGVSYANLRTLAKRIKSDQQLAEQLWATGNHDARILATMIADPAATSARVIEQWVKQLDNYVVTDALSELVARTSFARAKVNNWVNANGEWVGRLGWRVVGHLALSDGRLADQYFEPFLNTIASEIHSRKNRVREAMNGTLIAIGVRNQRLSKLALQTAKRIGKVEVDHGETGCKTPDAAEYIKRTLARKKRR